MGELFVSCGIVIEEGAVQGVRISGDCWNFWSMRELQLAGLEMLAGIFGSLACRMLRHMEHLEMLLAALVLVVGFNAETIVPVSYLVEAQESCGLWS
ncbi:hypothetical protein Droror1_Dr00002724 [Drosera rotundifolia]